MGTHALVERGDTRHRNSGVAHAWTGRRGGQEGSVGRAELGREGGKMEDGTGGARPRGGKRKTGPAPGEKRKMKGKRKKNEKRSSGGPLELGPTEFSRFLFSFLFPIFKFRFKV